MARKRHPRLDCKIGDKAMRCQNHYINSLIDTSGKHIFCYLVLKDLSCINLIKLLSQNQVSNRSCGYLGAHRTPSCDVNACLFSGPSRAQTISALCSCPMVCPHTLLRFRPHFCGLQLVRTVRAVLHSVRRTADLFWGRGGHLCRVIP
jgi:hypothetical protein